MRNRVLTFSSSAQPTCDHPPPGAIAPCLTALIVSPDRKAVNALQSRDTIVARLAALASVPYSGIGLLPPDVVHRGRAEVIYAARQCVLSAAYTAHPERFVRQAPVPPPLPTAAWINPPGPALARKQEVAQ